MFCLYDIFLDKNALSSSANNSMIDSLKIANGIYDHMNLLNIIDKSSNIFDTTIPESWTNNTIFNAFFENTTDAGNFNRVTGVINSIEIQRQEYGSDNWITLQEISKDETGKLNASFTFDDSYEKNNTQYKYQIVILDKEKNQISVIQQDVLSVFTDAYIADAAHIYKITNEYSLSNAQLVQNSVVYTPYGSKYPFVAYNAETQYNSASATAVLLAPTSKSNESSYIDRNAQVELVNEFNAWLANGRPKILKDFNGNLKIVTIIDPISNGYYKELANGLASTSFNWVEVGDFIQKDLDDLGMTNKFPLNYKK